MENRQKMDHLQKHPFHKTCNIKFTGLFNFFLRISKGTHSILFSSGSKFTILYKENRIILQISGFFDTFFYIQFLNEGLLMQLVHIFIQLQTLIYQRKKRYILGKNTYSEWDTLLVELFYNNSENITLVPIQSTTES